MMGKWKLEKSSEFAGFSDALAGEVESLVQEGREGAQGLRSKIEKLRRVRAEDFSALLAVEKDLLRYYPEEKLRRKAWLIKDKFRLVCGDAAYKEYTSSNPPDPASAPLPDLLADLEALLDQVSFIYQARLAREKALAILKRNLFLTGIVLTWGILFVIYSYQLATTFAVIVASGMVGAVMSIFRRIQTTQTTPVSDPVVELSSLEHGKIGIWLSMFSGGVFAVVLYILFASGLFTVPGVTPSFSQAEAVHLSGFTLYFFADEVGPKNYQDFAKIVAWSFAAGFLERLVPDVLDRLGQRAEAVQKK